MRVYVWFGMIAFGWGMGFVWAEKTPAPPPTSRLAVPSPRSSPASKPASRTSPSLHLNGTSNQKEDCNEFCRELVAKTLLESANEFYTQGHPEIAKRYIRRLLKKYGTTRSATIAHRLLLAWKKTSNVDLGGRIEFIVFTGLYGITLGWLIPLSFEAKGAPTYGISLLASSAIALGSAIFASSRWNITAGQASSITVGTVWGAWNLFALAGALKINQGADIGKMATLGSALGYAGGLAVGLFLKPSIAHVTFASSFGLWLTTAVGLSMAIMLSEKVQIPQETAFVGMILASNLGLLGGAFLHPQLRFSRARTLLLNVGAAVGSAMGAGAVLLVNPQSATPYLVSTLLGAGLGLGLTYFLTRNMRPEPRRSRELAAHSSLFHFAKGSWDLGLPMPSLLATQDGSGQLRPGFHISLASGSW